MDYETPPLLTVDLILQNWIGFVWNALVSTHTPQFLTWKEGYSYSMGPASLPLKQPNQLHSSP